MSVEDYFGMIMSILIGLTFIALLFAFIYMMYGEKEEISPYLKVKFYKKISERLLLLLFKFYGIS